MVPEGWVSITLCEVCEGKIQTGPFGSQLYAHEYLPAGSDGVAVAMPKAISSNRIEYGSSDKISYQRAKSLLKHRLKLGDIVFSRRGDVARTAVIRIGDDDAICGTGCLRARPSQGTDSEFLGFVMGQTTIGKWLEENAVGQTMPNLNTEIVSKLPLLLPPLPEQRKIADILSTWDRAIETNEALLATARTQKRALMQSLLTGKRRFPEFEGQAWKEVRLGDVVSAIKGGGTPDKSNPNFWGGDVPWVSVKDLKADVLWATVDAITELGLSNSASNAFEKDTIVISTRMAVGATVKLGCRMAINQDLKAIIPNGKIRNDYLFHFLQMAQPKLEALGSGSTVKGIKLADVRRLDISYPSDKAEQDRIIEIAEGATRQIAALTANIKILRTEKKALMQQLLTGKRRVAV